MDKEYNSILIVVDRLSKILYYILVTKNIKALKLTKVFNREIIYIYSPLKLIILD
jgi:hypothetical protein